MIWSVVGWSIAVLVPWFILLLLALCCGLKAHRMEFRRGYSFLTEFPFEMFRGGGAYRHASRAFFYAFCAWDALAHVLPLVFLDFHPSLLSVAVLYLILGIAKNVLLALMGSIPAYEFKPHLLTFSIFGGISVLTSIMSMLFFINRASVNEGIAVTFAFVCGVIGLAFLLALVNPKLSKWTKLDAVVDADGVVTTTRPKPFPLAFTQWLMVLFSLLLTLFASIGFLIIVSLMV